MPSITIELPDEILAWIDEDIVARGEHPSVGAYIHWLVERHASELGGGFTVEELRKLVDDAEASGISPKMPDEILDGVLLRFRRGA
jgi:Arc/MetJ-type ribon-helix-helix transcriptional regulator